ncbi:MAG: response regulator receiver protein [Segetibacter sp.]|nr:response regulator receiver protein [Segetibacter sp.]
MSSLIKHILVADDDSDDVEMFQSAIEETCPNIKITIATDGVKLLSLLGKIPSPDVIFLDLNMPRKTGKECLKEIRMEHKHNSITIIMLSTSGNKADIDYCLCNGANYYFVKPKSFNELKIIVQKLCNGELNINE